VLCTQDGTTGHRRVAAGRFAVAAALGITTCSPQGGASTRASVIVIFAMRQSGFRVDGAQLRFAAALGQRAAAAAVVVAAAALPLAAAVTIVKVSVVVVIAAAAVTAGAPLGRTRVRHRRGGGSAWPPVPVQRAVLLCRLAVHLDRPHRLGVSGRHRGYGYGG